MHCSLKTIATAAALASVCLAASAGIVTKTPDLGDYWSPLGANGTQVYANSFVADETGSVTELGVWLRGGASDLRFQIFGSVGGVVGNGPDSSTALVSSGVLTGQVLSALTYVSASPTSSAALTAGQTYWFAATAVGLPGAGSYNVGGHTQNSGGINDNGSFWYSNANDGLNFDGRRLTPEMAFQVTIAGDQNHVPEPASFGLAAVALLAAGLATRRRA